MALFDMFKKTTTKNPTIKEDAIAYSSGAGKTFTDTYNDYLNSVETLDKAVRICANVASMAKLEVLKDVSGELKPLKVKNVDFEFNINEIDGQSDFLRKTFSSMFTQGASITLAQKSKQTGFIGFYPYNPASFTINASESAVIDEFVYTSEGGSEVTFKPQDVIYVNSTVDITNLVYPVSRLAALNDLMTLQANIMLQTTDFYAAGSKDSAIVSPKEPMSASNARLLKATFDEFIQSRQTRTLFLNTEVDVQSVSNSETPTAIMDSLTKINDIIVESFGIPEYLYGSYAGYVNDGAVKTAARLFFEVQLKPLFISFEHQMTRYFRNTLKLKNAVIKFNFDDIEILHDSLETKVDLAGKMLKMGMISLNESREMVELEPLDTEEANKHWLPAYLVSSRPVAIEDYADLLEAGFFDENTDMAGDADGISGSGGEDNEAELTNEEQNQEPETNEGEADDA